jgi:ribosomal protein S18 acetylase RimI-like enzyme
MIHYPVCAPAAGFSPYPAHLHLNLRPRIQARGVGERLVKAWMKIAAPGARQATHVDVNRQNERAIRFWRRIGFHEIELKDAKSGRTAWLGSK